MTELIIFLGALPLIVGWAWDYRKLYRAAADERAAMAAANEMRRGRLTDVRRDRERGFGRRLINGCYRVEEGNGEEWPSEIS